MNPYLVSWNITNRCNLECSYCKLGFNNTVVNELNLFECKKIIDDLSREKIFMISFTGGEPLVREDFLEIIEYCSKKNITSIIATNGMLLDKDKIKFFKKHKVSAIAVSLDSIREEKNDKIRGIGTYKKILEVLKMIKTENMNLIMSITVRNEDIEDLEELLKKAKEYNCDKVKLQIILSEKDGKYYLDMDKNDLQKIAKVSSRFCSQIKDLNYISFNCYCNYLNIYFPNGIVNKTCNAGEKRAVIMANGDLQLCELLSDTYQGNLLKNNFKEIWKEGLLTNQFKLGKKCKKCDKKEICQGGCPIFNYKERILNDIKCINSFEKNI